MATKTKWQGLLEAVVRDYWMGSPPTAENGGVGYLTIPIQSILVVGQALKARRYQIANIRLSPRYPDEALQLEIRDPAHYRP